MKQPPPILKQPRMQEECTLPPGHCLDPFTPLWGMDDPDDDVARRLYNTAMEIDRFGLKGDFQEAIEDITVEIKTKILSWYEIGLKAWKIKLYKAYDKRFKSFRAFCEQALGRTAGTINNWIRAARVMSQLIASPAEFDRLPASAAVAIELSKFAESDLEEAWIDLCHKFADHEMTLEKVKGYLQDPFGKEPQFKNVRVPRSVWERLRSKAAESGMSPSKLLEQLLDGVLPEPEPEEEEPDEDEEPSNWMKRVKANFQTPEDEYYSFRRPLIKDEILVPF